MKIPITIGVTGHRDLREEDIPALREQVRKELVTLMEKYPSSPLQMLSSAASGADTLCAQEALKLGIKLICPLPMPQKDYQRDFSPEELVDFEEILSAAEDVFTVPGGNAQDMGEKRGYRLAGIYVATHCHVLLACWDGSDAKEDGCGTAEAVDFMLNNSFNTNIKELSRLNAEAAVLWVKTPRKSAPKKVFPIETTLIENKKGALEEILAKTDEFNKNALQAKEGSGSDLASPELMEKAGPAARRMNSLRKTSSRLSSLNQENYLKSLRVLSALGILLAVALLGYGSFDGKVFLLFYLFLLLGAGIYLIIIKKKDYHGKYLQYRVLSEMLRAQFFLCALGEEENICEEFTWTQKADSLWIKKALDVTLSGSNEATFASPQEIKAAWIENQLVYHKKAALKNGKKDSLTKATSLFVLILSLLVHISVTITEFFFGEFMDSPLPFGLFEKLTPQGAEEITLGGLFGIILGVLPLAALFFSNYYGKLSLGRKKEDNEKMADLFAFAQASFDKPGCDHKRLFKALDREEIIENGNWYSYCKDNSPSLDI